MASIARTDPKTGCVWLGQVPHRVPFNELDESEQLVKIVMAVNFLIEEMLEKLQKIKNEDSLQQQLKLLLPEDRKNGNGITDLLISKTFLKFKVNCLAEVQEEVKKEFPVTKLSEKRWREVQERAERFFDSGYNDVIQMTLKKLIDS